MASMVADRLLKNHAGILLIGDYRSLPGCMKKSSMP
jgi:hypothetical protein